MSTLNLQNPVSLPEAMVRGFRLRCPNCGRGKLFGRFLKVVDHCSECGEEFFHQRADDFPAYLVIALVGHTVVPMALGIDLAYAPPYWLQLSIWLPLTFLLAVALLQPIKGAIVGMQWQIGMHGFEAAKQRRPLAALVPARTTTGAAVLRPFHG